MDLPSGTILMWPGGSSIPSGWAILDSDYHTKPIKGFDSNYDNFSQTSPVAYAGAAHGHTFNSPSTSGGVSHNHGTYTTNLSTSSSRGVVLGGGYGSAASKNHVHGITIGTGDTTNTHTHTLTLTVGAVSTIPAYKTIVLIRKI